MAACPTCPNNCPFDCPPVDLDTAVFDADELDQLGDHDPFGPFADRDADYYVDAE